MSQNLQPVRGTADWLPEQMRRFHQVVHSAREVSARFGFAEVMLPIFEFSEVFHRTLGETSDVVSKETYTFTDRGGESITLRPELTAGIARAFISNNLKDHLPCKFFYAGPAFRYERPQKGRLRQFHQIGTELLGVPEVQADVEVIAMAAMLLGELGLTDHVSLELNSLGDAESRARYREQLVEYLTKHRDQLSEESRSRLERNPLRVLDSKNEGDRQVVAGAPALHGAFNETSQAFFTQLREGLDQLGVRYHVNDRLVRGLDYYTHTVFEFTTEALGAQGTVLAGGRYDHLIAAMGGPEVPGIGWAAGVERMCLLLDTLHATLPQTPPMIVVVPMSEQEQKIAMELTQRLRLDGLMVEMGYRGNAGKRLKKADKMNAALAVIIGEEERATGEATVRSLATGEQQRVAFTALGAHLKRAGQR